MSCNAIGANKNHACFWFCFPLLVYIITMAEASFLAAREARSLHRAPAARREEKDRLNEFWASLKEYTKDWNDRLATLAASDPPTTESEKRRLQEQFTELAQQLHSVRKLCLSVSSSSTGSSAAEEESQQHHVAADAVNSIVYRHDHPKKDCRWRTCAFCTAS